MIPAYSDINLTNYVPICGFNSLGFIEYHYPNIKIIDLCQWRLNGSGYNNGGKGYQWLEDSIKAYLRQDKIVLLVPDDEEILMPPDDSLTYTLNQFINDPVYLITQLDEFFIYEDEHNIKCKIIELPWLLVNDCMCYHHVIKDYEMIFDYKNTYNYISFIGRIERHKTQLAEELHNNNLSKYGLITTMTQQELNSLPDSFKDFCVVNKFPPYEEYDSYRYDVDHKHDLYSSDIHGYKESGYYKINDVWVSSNVNNLLHLQQEYPNVPLVVHAESTLGVFFNTEKSIWPILLGKLLLVYGRPGTMAWIQRFYDIDISSYADITFDSIDGWDKEAHELRLHHLINDNQDLIRNASDVHNKLKPQLEACKTSFAENLYAFFISQLNKIYN
jgi:hypothetical protein